MTSFMNASASASSSHDDMGNNVMMFKSFIQPHISSIIQFNKNTSHPYFELGNPRPSTYNHHMVYGYCTRLDVKLNFCGEARLLCEVIYDSSDSEYPPDMIIAPYLIPDSLFTIPIEDIQPLLEWDGSKVDCLLQVLLFIRKLYSEFLRAQVEKFHVDKVKWDYDMLKHNPDMDCAIQGNGTIVRIEIPVSVSIEADDMTDFMKGPFDDQKLEARITITHHVVDGKVQTTEQNIELPAIVEKERALLFKAPAFEHDTLITDFIDEVEQALASSRDFIKERKSRKMMFIKAMTVTFQQHILEYDAVYWSYMAFYMEVVTPQLPHTANLTSGMPSPLSGAGVKENCHAIVAVHLSDSFPRSSPLIFMLHPFIYRILSEDSVMPTLLPTSSLNSYLPYQAELKLTYNYKDSIEILVSQLKEYLMDQIPAFHSEAIRNGRP